MNLRERLKLNGLTGGASLLFAAQAFGLICALGTTVLWTRFMPVDLFGEFRVVMGAVGFVSAFCLMGTSQAALMSAARDADGNLLPLVRAKVIANSLASIVLCCAALYHVWGPPKSVSLALGLFTVAVLFPLYNVSDVWMSWINGKSRLVDLALSRSVASAIGVVAIALAVVLSAQQLWLVCLLFVGLTAVQSIWGLAHALRLRANDRADTTIPAFGVHSSIAMAFTGLLSLDVVALNHLYSARDVAIYAVALQFPEMLKRLFSALNAAVSPKIYAAPDFESLWSQIRGAFLVITAGCIAIGVAGFLVLPPLTILLFSEHYAAAAEYGRWLWLVVACVGSTTLLAPALLATQKPFFVYAPYVGYPLVQAILFAVMVSGGIGGLTLARIVGVVVLGLFYIVAFIYCMRARDINLAGAR